MAWDLSPERKQARSEMLRSMWLAHEEVILNHLKMTAVMFRWCYRSMGVVLFLSALAILAVGLFSRNLWLMAISIPQIPIAFKLFKHEYKGKYEGAFVEIEAAVDAVRRGESDSFPPEYTPATQKLREPLLGDVSGQMAMVAGVLFFCAALCIGAGVSIMSFFLASDGLSALFWGLSPVYIFLIFIGALLGVWGVVYAKSAWVSRKR